MFLLRGRSKNRQSVAPSPPTAAPSTSVSFSLRSSTSHSSSSHYLPSARRPSTALPAQTDGWVCDPAISALHFSYALTAQAAAEEAEEAEDDADRCGLQSPRPIPSPCESPVSFLSLDASTASPHSLEPTTLTAATMPTTYRRIVLGHTNQQTDTDTPRSDHHSLSRLEIGTDTSTSPANRDGGSGSSTNSSGRKQDWLQSSLRAAFGRRTADKAGDEAVESISPRVIEVEEKRGSGSVGWSDKSRQPHIPKLMLPLSR